MNNNTVFAIRLLEKIGAPLVAAIETAPPVGENADVTAAEMMAKMLGQAVQISIKLSATMKAQETEEQADSTRLSLAAIATPLLAKFYEAQKRVPEEADIARITKSLEAVIGFADKFTPAADGQSRLTTIDHDIAFYDETQAILTTMQALTPALLAISEFSFGQSDTKVMQEVAAKLEAKAIILAGNESNKLGQILVMKSLATLYAQCHRAEVDKMSASGQDAAPTMQPIWEAFEKRVMMMQVIVGQDVQAVEVDAGNAGGDVQPSAAPVDVPPVVAPVQMPTQTPTEPPKDVQAAPVAAQEAPAPVAEAASAAPASSGGPMGFFKPGGKTDDASAPPPEVPAVESPQAPPTPPPAAPPVSPPAAAPPPAGHETTATDGSFNDSSSQQAPPSSPMGFFKPGVKKKEDE